MVALSRRAPTPPRQHGTRGASSRVGGGAGEAATTPAWRRARADLATVAVGLVGLSTSSSTVLSFFVILFLEAGIWPPPLILINTGMNTQADCLPT